MKEARRARADTHSLRSNFETKFKGIDEDLSTVRKLRETFAPQEQKPSKADPIDALEQQIDYYLEQAMEAKTKGSPIPLTTNAAIQSFQNLIELHKTVQEYRKELDELRSGMNQANDPQMAINNMAYATMETFLQSAIDGMYGNDPAQGGVRESIRRSAVDMIGAHLKELQAKAPAQWDRVRRNSSDLQKIVNTAIRQLVPPKAMQLIENDTLQNTEMKSSELWQAWREAEGIKDPQERRRIRTMIRRDILEAQFNGKKPKRGY
jgi:molybdopterin converting factor small subunit